MCGTTHSPTHPSADPPRSAVPIGGTPTTVHEGTALRPAELPGQGCVSKLFK